MSDSEPDVSDTEHTNTDTEDNSIAVSSSATSSGASVIAKTNLKEIKSIWDVFSSRNGNLKAQCCVKLGSAKACGKVISRGGKVLRRCGNGNMWQHLLLHHPTVHKVLKKIDTDQKAAKAAATTAQNEITLLPRGQGQATIQEGFNRSRPYAQGDPIKVKLDHMVAEFIIDCRQPYYIVENLRFRALLKEMDPRYEPPHETHIRIALIPRMYTKVRHYVQTELAKCSIMAATTDMWTNDTNQSFVSLTVHYIDEDWKRRFLVLGCVPHTGSHNAASIAAKLKEILKDWGLLGSPPLFVRDSDPKLVLAFQNLGYAHASCVLHTLNLVVQHAIYEQSGVKLMLGRVTSMVGHYRRSSTRRDKLQEWLTLKGLPEMEVLGTNPTRWNNNYDMLDRVKSMEEALKGCNNDLNLKSHMKPTPLDYRLMEKVLKVLKPFKDMTNVASRHDSSISEVIPIVRKLHKQMNTMDTAGVGTMVDSLKAGLDTYFYDGGTRTKLPFPNIEKTPKFTFATLLDPRYKSKFLFPGNANAAINALKTEVEKVINDSNYQPGAKVTKSKSGESSNSTLSTLADSDEDLLRVSSANPDNDAAAATANEMINTYLNEPRPDPESDPLVWYAANQKRYWPLALLAKKYLSPPSSSIASEREFKIGSQIDTPTRNRLSPKNLERLLFLYYNLKAIGFRSHLLPMPEVERAGPLNLEDQDSEDDDTDHDGEAQGSVSIAAAEDGGDDDTPAERDQLGRAIRESAESVAGPSNEVYTVSKITGQRVTPAPLSKFIL